VEGVLAEIITPEFIVSEMDRHGYSALRLASDLGVSQRAVDYWMKGTRRPNLRDSERLLNAFGYRVEVFHE
jgi:transcriptional regulator with XRE-family HTH domain